MWGSLMSVTLAQASSIVDAGEERLCPIGAARRSNEFVMAGLVPAISLKKAM
jgi:hypothetical protein